MQRIVGVRFKEAGRIYYFDPQDFEVEEGEFVVVETPRGLEIAWVVIAPDQLIYNEVSDPKPIARLATDADIERWEGLKRRAREDFEVARRIAIQKGLPMKVSGTDYDLEGRTLAVYYTSEDRVDLRDLGQELQRELRTQVQFRQIGPRDQAKLVDGYGVCGRRLCCSSWLTNFPSISIKMAKEQDLPLNPTKISGECGRLLCCLSYENDQYREMRSNLPARNQLIQTPAGTGKVVSVNILRQSVVVLSEAMLTAEYAVHQLGFVRRDGGTAVPQVVEPTGIEEFDAPDAFRAPVRPQPQPRRDRSSRPPQRPRPLREGERVLPIEPQPPIKPEPTADASAEGVEGAAKRRRRRRGGRNRRRGGGAGGEAPTSTPGE